MSQQKFLLRKFKQLSTIITCSILLLHIPNTSNVFNNHPEDQAGHKDAVRSIMGDTLDKELSAASLCKECAKKARCCAQCKWLNSQASLLEIEEAEQLW